MFKHFSTHYTQVIQFPPPVISGGPNPWICSRPASQMLHMLHTNVTLNCFYPAQVVCFVKCAFPLLFFFFLPIMSHRQC